MTRNSKYVIVYILVLILGIRLDFIQLESAPLLLMEL